MSACSRSSLRPRACTATRTLVGWRRVMEKSDKALYDKARLFMHLAHEQPIESQLFAFWASLSLELLCRAALAKVHPVLLADPREDGNILYAFGIQPARPPKGIVT